MQRILIVEDNELNLDLLVQLLEDDYELVTADNGADGIEIAEQERPDLILMDMSLPVMDGWEATRRIKAKNGLTHIPIIALTAHAMSGDEAKAREAGCDEFDTKPVELKRLLSKMEGLLGGG